MKTFKLIYDMGELGRQEFECSGESERVELQKKHPPGPFVEWICLQRIGHYNSLNRNPSYDPTAYFEAVEDKHWRDEYQRRTSRVWKEDEKPSQQHDSRNNIASEKVKLNEADCLNLLGLKTEFTQAQLKEAWKRMLKMNHPDKVASLSFEFKELAEKRRNRLTTLTISCWARNKIKARL